MKMHLGMSLFAVVLATSLPMAAHSAGAGPPAASAIRASVDKVVNQAVQDKVFPGAVLGVAVDGKILFVRGYGFANLEDRAPVTEKTVFRIGSTTKQFTAAGVLRLVDQGKMSLDDPLSKYFPDFPRAGEVTVRQLLGHTSGIASYTNPKTAAEFQQLQGNLTLTQLIAVIANQKATYDFDPGTAWSYTNSGYILLGAIIEKVSGKSYAQYLKDEFFDPLGLKDTAVDNLATIVPDRAQGYDASKSAPTGFTNTTFISLSLAYSAGAIRSTAPDLLKWHIALFGGQVLKPESLAQMTTPGRLKDGRVSSAGKIQPVYIAPKAEYGFGLYLDTLDERRTIGHAGAINGFNTWQETFPDQHVTIVLLSNAFYPAAENTGPKVAKALFDTLKR